MQIHKKYTVYLDVAEYPKVKPLTKYIASNRTVFHCYINLLMLDKRISNNLYRIILDELNTNEK